MERLKTNQSKTDIIGSNDLLCRIIIHFQYSIVILQHIQEMQNPQVKIATWHNIPEHKTKIYFQYLTIILHTNSRNVNPTSKIKNLAQKFPENKTKIHHQHPIIILHTLTHIHEMQTPPIKITNSRQNKIQNPQISLGQEAETLKN